MGLLAIVDHFVEINEMITTMMTAAFAFLISFFHPHKVYCNSVQNILV